MAIKNFQNPDTDSNQKTTHHDEIQSLKRVNNTFKELITEKDRIIVILTAQNQSLFKSLADSEDFFQKIGTQNEVLCQTIEAIITDRNTKNGEMEHLQQKFEDLKRKKDTMANKETITALQASNVKLKSLLAQSRDKLIEFEKKVKDLNNSLELSQSRYHTVRKSRIKAIEEVNKLKKTIIELSERNELLNEEIITSKEGFVKKTGITTKNEKDSSNTAASELVLQTSTPNHPDSIQTFEKTSPPYNQGTQLTTYSFNDSSQLYLQGKCFQKSTPFMDNYPLFNLNTPTQQDLYPSADSSFKAPTFRRNLNVQASPSFKRAKSETTFTQSTLNFMNRASSNMERDPRARVQELSVADDSISD